MRPVGVQTAKFAIADFEASEGQVVENVLLDLSKSHCVLEGVMLDHNGVGLRGREINATFTAALKRLYESIVVTTDAEGHFRFEGLPPDKFTVRANTFSEPPPQATVVLNEERPTQVRVLDYIPGGAPPVGRTWQLAWGRQNTDSIEAALSIEPHKTEYAVGDKLTVHVLCRNPTADPIFFQNAFTGTSELQVVDPQGAVLQTSNYLRAGGVFALQKFYLAADEEVEMGNFSIALVDAQTNQGAADASGTTLCVKGASGQIVSLQAGLGTQTRNLPGRAAFIPLNVNPGLRWSTGVAQLRIRVAEGGK